MKSAWVPALWLWHFVVAAILTTAYCQEAPPNEYPALYEVRWRDESRTDLPPNATALASKVIPNTPIYGGTLTVEVWEPWNTTEPAIRETITFPPFKGPDTPCYECNITFYTKEHRGSVPAEVYPALVEAKLHTGKFNGPATQVIKRRLPLREALPKLYEASNFYPWKGKTLRERLPIFHVMGNLDRYGFQDGEDFETVRKATPYGTHIVAWFEAQLEPPQQTHKPAETTAATTPASSDPPAVSLVNEAESSLGNVLDIEKQRRSPAGYEGKVLVLNYWATWCAHCVAEFPYFDRLHTEFGKKGVEVVAVSFDRDKSLDQIRAFSQRRLVKFPMVLASEQTRNGTSMKALPMTMIYGKDRKLLFEKRGAMTWEELEKAVRTALDER